MNVTVKFLWKCAAEGCDVEHTDQHVFSTYAALDQRSVFPRPHQPLGWNVVDGKAYCGRHTIEVTAIIRTPTLIQFPGGQRVCVAGDLVEELRLRNVA